MTSEPPKDSADVNDQAGLVPSHGIEVDAPQDGQRPRIVTHMSSPAYQTPIRHARGHSSPRQIKETLNARSEYTNSEDDGVGQHRINQYIIKQEIGRGSFGAVHLAVDQYGNEFAVKEFSKSRLRKRAQSNILRRPHAIRTKGHLAAGRGFNSPLHRHSSSDIGEENTQNPLHFIREEVAIMKKLDHENLVSLIEVLDDPEEDSLYMVLEMCHKGVIMNVGIGEQAKPYDEETCRRYFRELILGMEYLHAQGVLHRDIKPDNLLLNCDDSVKIVDFGVSEMFEKAQDMKTAKSAGSPAFLPPELCVVKHGEVSGKAADIWSMGVTLYCMRFGRIPFERSGVLELYESIKHDTLNLPSDLEPDFVELMHRLLEKDPNQRIKMSELRNHPWVTKNGTFPIISEEENTAKLVDPPTEAEMNSAITGNFKNLLVVMKAVTKFKSLVFKKRPDHMQGVLGSSSRMVQPPESMDSPRSNHGIHKSKSVDTSDRKPVQQALAIEGIHQKDNLPDGERQLPERIDSAIALSDDAPAAGSAEDDINTRLSKQIVQARLNHEKNKSAVPGGPNSVHDPSHGPPAILSVGPGGPGVENTHAHIVSESPPATDINVYEKAYHEEVERIRGAQGRDATVYLTRRVDSVNTADGQSQGGQSAWKRAMGKIGEDS